MLADSENPQHLPRIFGRLCIKRSMLEKMVIEVLNIEDEWRILK
ncbi:hypothetical protein [Rossellomorea marisflavi]|nr:hypothetical protein [Rossellomorea marisflavi]